MMNVSRVAMLVTFPIAALAACGGDDDTPSAEAPPAATADPGTADDGTDASAGESVTDTADDGDAGDAGDGDVGPAPAEPSGTVSVDGFSYDLTGDDLPLCETVNPAFAETINIQARFDVDPDAIVVHGTTIGERMSLSVIGDLPDDVTVEAGDADLFGNPAQVVEVTRDGRTVSGTATVIDERVGASVTDDNPLKDTTIEFTFDC